MQELEAMKCPPITLKTKGDEVTFCMADFSMHKQTGKVWHSPPFYFDKGCKLCLAVYANGKGAGAGTHVSIELLQMRVEYDENLKWQKEDRLHYHYARYNISIEMLAQCKKTSQKKEFSLAAQLNFCCLNACHHMTIHVYVKTSAKISLLTTKVQN